MNKRGLLVNVKRSLKQTVSNDCLLWNSTSDNPVCSSSRSLLTVLRFSTHPSGPFDYCWDPFHCSQSASACQHQTHADLCLWQKFLDTLSPSWSPYETIRFAQQNLSNEISMIKKMLQMKKLKRVKNYIWFLKSFVCVNQTIKNFYLSSFSFSFAISLLIIKMKVFSFDFAIENWRFAFCRWIIFSFIGILLAKLFGWNFCLLLWFEVYVHKSATHFVATVL